MSTPEDENLSILGENTVGEEVEQKLEAVPHRNKPDHISSGESKFKHYSFQPDTNRNDLDIKKCIDFWDFIGSQNNIFPQRGYDIKRCEPQTSPKKANEEELTWSKILHLLKQKQLDKVARHTKINNVCEPAPCRYLTKKKHGKTAGAEADEFEDDFKLDQLDAFDPQRKVYADATEQTDPIVMEDCEIQTEITPELLQQQKEMSTLDDLLKNIAATDRTGYFDCICDDPCAWLPYATDGHVASSHSALDKSPSKDACTCSCGQAQCLCSLCSKILTMMDAARREMGQLSSFEIEECPCSDFSCACLADYQMLLDIKLEINKEVRRVVEDPGAVFGTPLHCKCSCNQINCPCRIVMKLFMELDQIMGYKEKPLFYFDEDLDLRRGVDVCRCAEGDDEMRCSCLNFYQRNIRELQKAREGSGQPGNERDLKYAICPSTVSDGAPCTRECTESATCLDWNEITAVSSSDISCMCAARSCVPSETSLLVEVKNYENADDVPATPPNSRTC